MKRQQQRNRRISLALAFITASIWISVGPVYCAHSAGVNQAITADQIVGGKTDEELLRALNSDIGNAESSGDQKFLASILAPELAFLRADGKTVDDAGRFLQKVRPSEPRTTVVESVEVLGNRAIVKCTVTQAGRSFHNLRLFIRDERSWRLLGWANEEVR